MRWCRRWSPSGCWPRRRSLGLALSLRHGQVVAAVGLIGAFATPALVQTEHPSLPGLFGYLLFVTAAALAVVRYTAWVWLGWATTVAGAVWVVLAIVDGVGIDAWAPALFVPAAAALNLALLPAEALDHVVGRRLAWVPVAALGVTGLLLASLEPGGGDAGGSAAADAGNHRQGRPRTAPAHAALRRRRAVPAAAGRLVHRDPRHSPDFMPPPDFGRHPWCGR